MNPRHHKKRKVDVKCAHHIVLKSWVNVFHQSRVRQITDSLLVRWADYFGIKIYHRAVVGDHLHLLLLTNNEEKLSGFLRVLSGQISSQLREKGIISKSMKNLWKSRPFSRVLKWGRAYRTAIRYVAFNYLEGVGLIRRTHQRDEISRFRERIEEVLENQWTQLPDKQLRFGV